MATIKTTIKRRNGTGWDELRPKTEVDQITDFDANVPDNLDDLTNVNAPSPSNGQALVWDSSTSKWIPGTVAVDISGKVSKSGDTMTGTLTASGGINGLTLSNGISGTNFNITGVNELSINDPGEGILFTGGSSGNMLLAIVDDSNDNILRFSGTNAELQVGTNKVWHAGNDDNLTKRYTWQPGIVYWHNGGTDAGFRNILKVDSSTLSTGGILYVDGTTNSVVVNAKFEILVNHYQDIVVKSLSGGYTQVKIKVQSGNNEDFNVLIARDGNDTNTTTITATFIPYDQNATVTTYTNNPAVSYSSIIHTHGTLAFSENITATGGSTGKLFIEGNTVWHAGNDGASSGLDADTLDTYQASQFLRSDADDTMTGNLTISNTLPTITLTDTDHNNDFNISNNNGVFTIGDTTTQTDRLVLNSSGNVGIGTTSPSDKLDVLGDFRISRTTTYTSHWKQFISHTGTSNYGSLYLDSNSSTGDFIVRPNGSEKFRIKADGNVGIGTTSPETKLEVQGSTLIGSGIANSRSTYGLTAGFTSNSTFSSNADVGDSNRTLSLVNESTTTNTYSTLSFRNSPTSGTSMADFKYVHRGTNDGDLIYTNNNGGTWTDQFSILSNGNVGIGTTSPAYKLQVSGTTYITNGFSDPSSETGYRLKFYDNGGTTNDAGIGLDGSAGGSETMWFNSLNGFYWNDGTSGKRMTLDTNGNLGIGTTTPGAKLDVAGQVNVQGNILLTGTATTTNQGRMIDFTGFDKEGTTDFTDRAYIQHTTNTGGHTGSVLVISSQNDSSDGIAFSTNASSLLKHNSNNIFTDGYHPNADKWTTARTITLSGDLSGSVSLDGSANVTLSAQVSNNSHEHDYLPLAGGTMTGYLTISSGSPTVRLLDTSGTDGYHLHANNSNFYILQDSTSDGTYDSIPFILTESGNVGIGVTSPSEKLEVNGKVVASNGRLGAIEYNGSDVDKVNFALSGSTLTITTS